MDKCGFQRKTINAIIRGKIDDWFAKSIASHRSDKQVITLKEDIIVTGGAIASMLMGDMPNDYDVYFATTESCKSVAEIYCAHVDIVPATDYSLGHVKCRTAPAKHESTKEYTRVSISENAITLSDDIQIVTRFCGSPAEVHRHFDFIHTTNYWTYEEGIVLNQRALESIMSQQLVYFGSMFPLATLFRLRKFLARGWKINAGEIFKIAYDVNRLDLSDRNTVREQLIGVDMVYFKAFVDAVEKRSINFDDRVSLFEILEKVFDDDFELAGLDGGSEPDTAGSSVSRPTSKRKNHFY